MTIGFTGTRQIDKISEGRLSLLSAWLEMYSIKNSNYIRNIINKNNINYGARKRTKREDCKI